MNGQAIFLRCILDDPMYQGLGDTFLAVIRMNKQFQKFKYRLLLVGMGANKKDRPAHYFAITLHIELRESLISYLQYSRHFIRSVHLVLFRS